MTRPSGSSDAAAPTDSPPHIDAPPSAPVDEKGKGKAIKSDDCMEEVDDDEEDDEDDGDDDDEAEDDEMDDVSVFRAHLVRVTRSLRVLCLYSILFLLCQCGTRRD